MDVDGLHHTTALDNKLEPLEQQTMMEHKDIIVAAHRDFGNRQRD
jgi:hypothetical protein